MQESHMVAGQWYDLEPPVSIKGKRFSKVFCKFQVPNAPNEYRVRGIPIGDDMEEREFLLVFRSDRAMKATLSRPPESPKQGVVK